MKFQAIFVIAVTLITQVLAFEDYFQRFGNSGRRVGQSVGQAMGQFVAQSSGYVASFSARTAADFKKFPDKSKQAQHTFTLPEVQKCNGQNSECLYIVFKRSVLDCTQLAKHHYGGSELIRRYGGQDATEAMLASGMPEQVFSNYVYYFKIGTLVPSDGATDHNSSNSTSTTTTPAH